MENENKMMSRLEYGIALYNTNIAVTHDVYINGEFSGNLITNSKVIIDEKAVFIGTVAAQDVEIMGHFEGDCYVKGQLLLRKGCCFSGNLSYGEIVTENGAIVKGSFKKMDGKEFDDKLAKNEDYQHLVAPGSVKKAKDKAPSSFSLASVKKLLKIK